MFDATKLPRAPAQPAASSTTSGGASASARAPDASEPDAPVPSYPAKSLVLDAGRYRVADNEKSGA